MKSHPNELLIIQAIQAGRKYRDIIQEYGCSWIMIRDWKKRLGFKIKSPDRSKETDRKIKEMLDEGKTYAEIIKALGVHSQRIQKVKNGKVSKVKRNEFGNWF